MLEIWSSNSINVHRRASRKAKITRWIDSWMRMLVSCCETTEPTVAAWICGSYIVQMLLCCKFVRRCTSPAAHILSWHPLYDSTLHCRPELFSAWTFSFSTDTLTRGQRATDRRVDMLSECWIKIPNMSGYRIHPWPTSKLSSPTYHEPYGCAYKWLFSIGADTSNNIILSLSRLSTEFILPSAYQSRTKKYTKMMSKDSLLL